MADWFVGLVFFLSEAVGFDEGFAPFLEEAVVASGAVASLGLVAPWLGLEAAGAIDAFEEGGSLRWCAGDC